MNCLKKIMSRYNFVPMLIGMLLGVIISVIVYPGYEPPKERVQIVEKPVYIEIETVKEIPVYIAEDDGEQVRMEYLGEFELTAYCSCEKCCGKSDGITASGAKATSNHTIAVDPTVIPYGTEVMIDGKRYVAEDCGGGVKGNVIDIYFDTHEEAVEFGRQKAEVYVFEESDEE